MLWTTVGSLLTGPVGREAAKIVGGGAVMGFLVGIALEAFSQRHLNRRAERLAEGGGCFNDVIDLAPGEFSREGEGV